MSIEFFVFILAVAILLIARNWAKFSGITSMAGTTITSIGGVGEQVRGYLKWVLLAGSTLLLIILTLPIEENQGVILPLTIALIVIVLLTMIWPETFKSTIMRWVIYIYALAVIDISFMNLFPVFMVKHAHFDPSWLKTTRVESELYRLHKTEREIADQNRAREIAQITEKVKRGENLSEAEKKIVQDADARGGMLRPDEKKVRETAQAARAPRGQFTETITVLPGKRAYVPVREGYTAFYECDEWGNVEVPGSRVLPKGCGPRPSRPSDQWGKISGAVLTFTTASDRPLHVTVTQVQVK